MRNEFNLNLEGSPHWPNFIYMLSFPYLNNYSHSSTILYKSFLELNLLELNLHLKKILSQANYLSFN